MSDDGGCFGCGDQNPAGLGLRFARDGEDAEQVVTTFLPRPEHRGAPGFLHGGIAATCLDEAMASVGFLVDGVHCVTATLEVRYRRPVPLDGRPLRVEAWREHTDHTGPRRRHRMHGRIRLTDGTIAVESSGIFVTLPGGFADRP